jgi:hypothetical protein
MPEHKEFFSSFPPPNDMHEMCQMSPGSVSECTPLSNPAQGKVASPFRRRGLDIEVRSRDDAHFSRSDRRRIEVFIGREEVSKAIVKSFEDEGRAKELGIARFQPGGGRTSGVISDSHMGSSAIVG